VVDASIFPRIPGYFVASAIYIAAEKAADAILSAAMAENAAPARGELPTRRARAAEALDRTGAVRS
jgi:choline dehydrogenase-like flavoprotein